MRTKMGVCRRPDGTRYTIRIVGSVVYRTNVPFVKTATPIVKQHRTFVVNGVRRVQVWTPCTMEEWDGHA